MASKQQKARPQGWRDGPRWSDPASAFVYRWKRTSVRVFSEGDRNPDGGLREAEEGAITKLPRA